MNTDDMTREELIAHYEHRIACERQSHADRLAAAEKAFALWRERLGPNWGEGMTPRQVGAMTDAVDLAAGCPANDINTLVKECATHLHDIEECGGSKCSECNGSALNLTAAAIELMLRLTEGE